MSQCQAMGFHRVSSSWGWAERSRSVPTPRVAALAAEPLLPHNPEPYRSESCPHRGRRNRPRSWPWCWGTRPRASAARPPPPPLPDASPTPAVRAAQARSLPLQNGRPRPRLPRLRLGHAPLGVPPLILLSRSGFRGLKLRTWTGTRGIIHRIQEPLLSGRESYPRESEPFRPAAGLKRVLGS